MDASEYHINDKKISPMQAKILVLNIYDFSQFEMSLFLDKTLSTIQSYVKNLNDKLDVHCPTQMYRYSMKYGFDVLGHLNGIEIIPKIEIARFKDKDCKCAYCFDGFCLIHRVGLNGSK